MRKDFNGIFMQSKWMLLRIAICDGKIEKKLQIN